MFYIVILEFIALIGIFLHYKMDSKNSNSKNDDCYFYYYSTCSKGDSCPYRHEPAALKIENICQYWKKGFCNRTVCKFRHMNITKNRNIIPCFHEKEMGGCQKPHCPFLHSGFSKDLGNKNENKLDLKKYGLQEDWEGDMNDPMERAFNKASLGKSRENEAVGINFAENKAMGSNFRRNDVNVGNFGKSETSNIRKNELSSGNLKKNEAIENRFRNHKINSANGRSGKDNFNRNTLAGHSDLLELNMDYKGFDSVNQINIPRNREKFRQPSLQRCQIPDRNRSSRPLFSCPPESRYREVRDLSTCSVISSPCEPQMKEQNSRFRSCRTPEPKFFLNNGKTEENKFRKNSRRRNNRQFSNKKISSDSQQTLRGKAETKESTGNRKQEGGNFPSFDSNSLSVPQLAVALASMPEAELAMEDLVRRFDYGLKEVADIIASNPTLFDLKGNLLSLKSRNIICEKHISVDGCKSLSGCFLLHICLGFIYGWCKDDDCIYGHKWESNHNRKFLSSARLLNLPSNSLKKIACKILTSNSDKNSLKICEDYIEEKCSKGMNCDDIHFCIKYLSGLCSADSNCSLNHNIRLRKFNFLMSNAGISLNESPRDILTSFSHLPTIKDQIDSFTEKYKALAAESKKQSVQDEISKDTSTGKDNSGNTDDNKEMQKTMWAYEFRGDVQVGEICYNSVESLCVNETLNCDRLHCSFHFHWQIKSSSPQFNYWVNLNTDFVLALEKGFCDPSIDKMILPSLDPTSLPIIAKGLIIILKGKTRWEADFKSMELVEIPRKDSSKQTSDNSSIVPSTGDGILSTNLLTVERLKLRRLCTQGPSKNAHHIPPPCKYNWYFLDKCNNWIEYGDIDSTGEEKVRCDLTSQDIENAYILKQNSINFQSSSFKYTLDLLNMTQTNLKTKVQRAVKRRPMPHIMEEEKSSSHMELPSTWEPMKSDERVKRVSLLPNSKEYKEIITLLQQSPSNVLLQQNPSNVNVSKIERIQNPFHYRIFQQKVQEMTNIYKDPKIVDVRQLFHGTLPQCIQPICEQNFDWRLHGTHVGHAYGKGAYFSPFLSTSMGYSRPDTSGNHLMLISCVAVGTTFQGSSGIVRPPMNSTYNIPYDSTVDNISNPSIIVKYDKAEYYPQYIVTLR